MADDAKVIVDSFKKFDANGDGFISRDELKRVLNAISTVEEEFNDASVDALLLASDTNRDGKISYEEFVKWVTSDEQQVSSPSFKPLDNRGDFKMDFRKFLPERFQIDVTERFDIDKLELGAGGFGKVFVAKDKEFSNRIVAVKKVQKPKASSEELADLHREIAVMKDLDHPNICKLLATFEEGRNLFFVMELCEGGEVFDRILENGFITEKTTATIIQQVASALAHAHSRGIAHRDIKPENVVFCSKDKSDLSVKLIDWGLAVSVSGGMTKAVGSMTYAAPEVVCSQDKKHYTEACDLWSVGVMTYVMLSGKPPFWGSREQQVRASKMERYPFKGEPWDKMNPQAKDFVKKLLKADPKKRLPIGEVIAHPWLTTAIADDSDSKASVDVLKNLGNFCAQSTFSRMCITAVARQLDHKHLKDIHQVFREMDVNGDGVLSVEEVKNGFFRISGDAVDTSKLEEIFSRMDLDGSQTIDYTEFCAAGLDQKTTGQDDIIWAAFKTFDLENKGCITIDNLKRILDSADVKDQWTADVCSEVGSEIVAKFDKDKDGTIGFEEWREVMLSCWSKKKEACPATSKGTHAGSIHAYDILTKVSNLTVKPE